MEESYSESLDLSDEEKQKIRDDRSKRQGMGMESQNEKFGLGSAGKNSASLVQKRTFTLSQNAAGCRPAHVVDKEFDDELQKI